MGQVLIVCSRYGHSAELVATFTRLADASGQPVWFEYGDHVEDQDRGAFRRIVIECPTCGLKLEINRQLPKFYEALDAYTTGGHRFADFETLAATLT